MNATYMKGLCGGGEGYGTRVVFVPCDWDESQMEATASALKEKGWRPVSDLLFRDGIDPRRIVGLGEIPLAIF